jgi:glycosyltransferase involved in cell wall biosynthesis
MKKITWFGVAQSPYNDFLLSEVNKHFDLQVFYKIRKKGTHPWQLKPVAYDFRYLGGNFFKAFRRALSSDVIVVSGWSFWQHIILMLTPMRNTKKIYWTDTPSLDRREWSGIKGAIRKLLVKLCFATFDEVWSTGKPGCRALEQLGCRKDKIKSFPFFLDLSRYTSLDADTLKKAQEFRANNTNNNTEIVFLCMGQVASKKRFDDAVKAFSNLRKSNAVLWIAGTGPQEEELKELTIELGIVNQVFFLGWLQQNEVELAYIAADVFVHPASFDPFPTVVLDAMTWGKPVIGTNVSGSVEDRVVPSVNGYIYTEGEVETLADYMRFFIENRNEIKNYGKEARKTACAYPVDLAINKFQSLT